MQEVERKGWMEILVYTCTCTCVIMSITYVHVHFK